MYKEKKRIYIIIIIIREHVKKFHVYNNFILFFWNFYYKLNVNYNYLSNFNEYYNDKWQRSW